MSIADCYWAMAAEADWNAAERICQGIVSNRLEGRLEDRDGTRLSHQQLLSDALTEYLDRHEAD